MFDIPWVELTDFKSYVGTHTFTFPTEIGLYSVTGKNLKNPRLGPNGVGKSSLLDAIYWCLYGSTPRGLRASNVVARGKKHCRVRVNVLVGQTLYLIDRQQSPNSLSITFPDGKGKPVDQKELETYLRIGPQAFLYSILLPQLGRSFFDLGPSEKLKVFSEIMDLDFWLEKSKLATNLTDQIDADIVAVTARKAKAETLIEAASKDADMAKILANDFEETKRKTVAGFIAESRELEEEDAGYRKEEISLISLIGKEVEKELAKEVMLLVLRQSLKTATGASYSKKYINKDLANEYLMLEGKLEDLEKTGPVCLVCQQPVSTAHKKHHSKSINERLRQVAEALNYADLAEKKAEETVAQAEQAVRNAENDLKLIASSKGELERELTGTKSKRNNLISQIKLLVKQAKQEKDRENPHDKIYAQKLADKKAAQLESDKMSKKLASLEEEHTAFSFWINGFKKLRLNLIGEALNQLEIEVNNNLVALGLTDWRVEMDVERENKTGGIKSGFTVMVYAPDYDQPVPLESWSGGELQRLRLAGDFGLSNLILERAGLTAGVEFHDEPSEHLSYEGLLDLADTLKERAERLNRKVWLIDHTNLEYGGFAGTVVVTKDENGSHLSG